MEEIICRQKNVPRPMTARRFLMGTASIVLKLAIAQIVVNLAIRFSGIGLLNAAFYIYAVLLLVNFMRKTVASTVYMLKENTLVFQNMLGDSTTSVVEIMLDQIIALRPVHRCEDLKLSYEQVTRIGSSTHVGFRVRAAFFLSLFSARLARMVAGKHLNESSGWAVIFEENGKPHACVFRPNESFLGALQDALPEAFGVDDRMNRAPVRSIYGRSLQRAFPELYPHVEPLLREEDVRWAEEELEHQREAREKEKADKAMRAEAAKKRRLEKKEKQSADKETDGIRNAESTRKTKTVDQKTNPCEEEVQAETDPAEQTLEGETPRRRRKQTTGDTP